MPEEWGAAPDGRGAAHMSLTHANWTLGMIIWTRRICIGFTKPGPNARDSPSLEYAMARFRPDRSPKDTSADT